MKKGAWGTLEFFAQDLKRLLESCHQWDMFLWHNIGLKYLSRRKTIPPTSNKITPVGKSARWEAAPLDDFCVAYCCLGASCKGRSKAADTCRSR